MGASNVSHKLIRSHLVKGQMVPGEEIALRIDQTLTQDATGTLVMLELEAMGLDRVRTELSAQYVDHNIVQEDFKNADDHLFLRSACQRFGLYYSRPGNGVSHPVHQECFGKPGKTLLGSDSHTPAAGAIGMLAMGAGGLEVAMAMAGEPYHLVMPKIWGIRLVGELPDWVSAKDVILELLRRHGVRGGVGRILEYHGPGLAQLQTMDRHVLANMGTELGATTTVFPADEEVRRYLRSQGREQDYTELLPDPGASYDVEEEIDLSRLEPLTALPSSPGNVVPVSEVAGRPIYQAYIGSSANPGYRDLAVVAEIVKGRTAHDRVSFDVNPTTRQILARLIADGHLVSLTAAGARLHQTGCNGCIGMGQAPATDRISLRTVPRNFPGRSGTREDQVYLVSPETAAASALKGEITDPRTLKFPYPKVREPYDGLGRMELITPPLPPEEARKAELVRGPNIKSLPELGPLPASLSVPVLLKVGDDLTTDEILPAGTRVLPYRSNIPKISEFSFEQVDPTYAARAMKVRDDGGHVVIGGSNYGQGSSREHAALAPRYLGLRAVIAKSFARIHSQNLVNFGIAPLTFVDPGDYDAVSKGDTLSIDLDGLESGKHLQARADGRSFFVTHSLSPRQVEILRKGGLINWMKERLGPGAGQKVER
ncbi:aconitate hydratase [Vulgatibacter incomptus]|uniref:Aconitate hydratase n=1 Tax=Vulgatibacter incomptus TaxID=1391653 RepID=A0A0K1P968_9BACT|nr:aconitate hydratase [Vulgatibacter incomptus]AKU90065.1 Aconitate hydratase [Vulgatibacter incomptus]